MEKLTLNSLSELGWAGLGWTGLNWTGHGAAHTALPAAVTLGLCASFA